MHRDNTVDVYAYLEKFINIEANIIVNELGVEGAEVGVINVFKDQGRCFAL